MNNKNWIYIDSYIDEGISGTSTKKRINFLRLVEDAKNDKFDLILTKEISRFSRNTIDSIYYTSELLSYGVAVYFLSDNINTLNSDSELRLTIMSSIAQEEVRKLSERVKFGMQRAMKQGHILGGGNIIGYIKKDGKLIIDKQKRKMIEMLFNMYATGKYGFGYISKVL
jgi:DNA invertase Pin-like site-specific DNA recombinase